MAPPKAETTPSDTDDDYQSNVSSFLQRMYNPSITRDIESRMDPNDADLIHVPWKLSHTDDNGEKSNGAHIQSDEVGASNNDSSPVYPSMSYLDLRRIQNTEWATDRLREGVRLAKEGNAAKAEECYKEGIDLVPTHAQLFVAYGALCANLGRTREAIDKLEYALELDPNVANAQAYINVIRNKVPPRQAGSVSRSQTAMKDALMERSFLQESKSSADNQNEKYPLLHEEEEEKMDANNNHDETKDAKRKHRHKKAKRKSKHRDRSRHRKSRSRRKRRKHHDFSSDNDSESDDSASDDGRRRRRRYQRHSSSQESNRMHRPSTDERSEESNRRQRRHRKRYKRRRDFSSDASSDGSNDGREHDGREQRKKNRRPSRKSRERSPGSERT